MKNIVDYRRDIEIRKRMAGKSFRNYEEIPGLETNAKPTKWLYYFRETYHFIEDGTRGVGTHMRKAPQEAEGLLRMYNSDMMVTAVKIKNEDLVLPEILKGRRDLKILEVDNTKELSDRIFTETTVRIPVTELK
jgi:hypothetical protein